MELIKNPSLCNDGNHTRLRFLDMGYAHSPSSEWEAVVTSPAYSRLYYIIGGDPYITFGDTTISLKPDNCYLIPTGFTFSHNCRTDMEQVYFHINLLNANGYDLLRSCVSPLSIAISKSLPERLGTYIKKGGLVSSLLIESEVMSCLAHLFEENNALSADVKHSPCVSITLDNIAKNPTIQLTPSHLAELSFVSLSTLAKRFKQEIGKSIGAYIDDIVFFEAEQLLKKDRDEVSILDISQRLGFCDQFYFSRRFKEKYGITPQQYRKIQII